MTDLCLPWRLFVTMVFVFCLVSTSFSADFVILETDSGSLNLVMEGKKEFVDKKFSPVSTFKIILAWAGLAENIVATSTRLSCGDKHLPKGLKVIDLQQAMIFSSNDYFVEIGKKIGLDKVSEYAKNSGLFNPFPAENCFPNGIRSIASGGNLKVTPRDQHEFMTRIMLGQIKVFPRVYEDLLESMSWPSSDPRVKLFGKTGSGEGVVWFNGFGSVSGKQKAVTILMKGPVSLRDQAIAKFYSRFGIEWNERLLDRLRIAGE